MTDFWIFFKIGLNLVVDWQAYMHVLLLILLGAAFSFDTWKRLFMLLSLITLGFLLALLMVSYDVVRVNAGLVDFLTAVTLIFAALFTLFSAGKEKRRDKTGAWFAFVLFFGLLRGLDFGPAFNSIVGQKNKFLSIVEVALGIEVGQIAVVLIVLILAFLIQTLFRFNKRDWTLVVSSIVLGLAIPFIINHWIF